MSNDHAAVVTLLLENGSKGAAGVLEQRYSARRRGDCHGRPRRAGPDARPPPPGARRARRSRTPRLSRSSRSCWRRCRSIRRTRRSPSRGRRCSPTRAAIATSRPGRDHRGARRRPADGEPPGATPPLPLVAPTPTTFRVAGGTESRLASRAAAASSSAPWSRLGTRRRSRRASPRRRPVRQRRRPPQPRRGGRSRRQPRAADIRPRRSHRRSHLAAFRGDNAAGIGDGQGAVVDWDVASGRTSAGRRRFPASPTRARSCGATGSSW